MPRSGAPPRTRTTEDLSREPPTRAWGCSPELGGPSERGGAPRSVTGTGREPPSYLVEAITWGAPWEDGSYLGRPPGGRPVEGHGLGSPPGGLQRNERVRFLFLLFPDHLHFPAKAVRRA